MHWTHTKSYITWLLYIFFCCFFLPNVYNIYPTKTHLSTQRSVFWRRQHCASSHLAAETSTVREWARDDQTRSIWASNVCKPSFFLCLCTRGQSTWHTDRTDSEYTSIEIYCDPCRIRLPDILAYELHYEAVHRNVCSVCHKIFPGEEWLQLHLDEFHDVILQLKKDRGDKIVGFVYTRWWYKTHTRIAASINATCQRAPNCFQRHVCVDCIS